MMSRSSAYWTSLLLMSFPIVWALSEVALNYIVGLFFVLLIATLCYLCVNQAKPKAYLYGCAFLGGLSLGYRFAEYSIVVSLLSLILYKRKRLIELLKTTVYFLAGVMVWLVPTVIDTGLSQFVFLYREHSDYVYWHDSIFADDITFWSRLHDLKWLLETGYTKWIFVFFVIICFYIPRNWKKIYSDFDYLFIFVWLVSYAVPLFIFYNLEIPRYVLPLSVPLLLLIGKIADRSVYVKLILVFTIFPVFMTGLRYAYLQHITLPPTVAPVKYVLNNFDPKDTTVVSTFTYRQFQYYAPGLVNYLGSEAPLEFNTESVILEHNGVLTLPGLLGYNLVDEREFTGDRKIFSRVPTTKLFVYKKVDK